MNAEQWKRVKAVLQACLELPPDRRAAFLDHNCETAEDRAEVESLLASHHEAGEFLHESVMSTSAAAVAAVAKISDHLAPGERLGVYKLVQCIGEGGSGIVYQAVRDDDQFRKLVAIKIVKRGMDTDYILRRFENERQILAHFDHPNIAKLIDGGGTRDGRPYVVMEFVAGEPIDQFCDSHRLGLNERIEIFLKVCGAVQYAHQNLVVHRDLKPSNIMITTEGEPKLLDFGIAKLLSDEREFTAAGVRLMTPEYASPEQARGRPIGTPTDVYSLGMILYELLTGTRPYGVTRGSLEETAEMICNATPTRPSVAARAPGKCPPPERAENRGMRPERLARHLSGDLDNIVLMALRKEPQHRYLSVEQFASDLRRHLDGMPVIAHKSTVPYRCQKFIRRHAVGVLASAAIFLSLVAGIFTTTRQARIARRERERAERRFNDVRKLANVMMFDLYDSIDAIPGSTQARELLVRNAQEYLDNLANETAGDLALQRDRAAAYLKIGDVLGWPSRANLGHAGQALQSYRKAMEINQALVAALPGDVERKRELATNFERICSVELAGGKFQDARNSCSAGLDLRKEVVRIGPTAEHRADLGASYTNLAVPYSALGDWKNSEACRAQALEIFEELHRDAPNERRYHYELGVAYLRLANLQEQLKHYTEALANARRAVEVHQQLAERYPNELLLRLDATFAMQRMGSVLLTLRDFPGALAAFSPALPIREKIAEADPHDFRAKLNVARCEEAIGFTLLQLGRLSDAQSHIQAHLSISEQLIAHDPQRVEYQINRATALENLGTLAARGGRARDAMTEYNRALEVYRQLQERGAFSPENDLIYTRLQKERDETMAVLGGK